MNLSKTTISMLNSSFEKCNKDNSILSTFSFNYIRNLMKKNYRDCCYGNGTKLLKVKPLVTE